MNHSAKQPYQWSWDGTIVVALVPRIQEDSSFVFSIVAPGSLVCEHERNGYRRFLPANIKYYLSRITERSIK